jgi:REP element-mobilizing transposase RayT
MKYDPAVHHRRSVRLQGYDYSRAGAYFITICTRNRTCLFGAINYEKMVLNDAGQIVVDEWMKTAEIRRQIKIDEFVVMPNHFHGIVWVRDANGRGTARRAPTTMEQFGKPVSGSIPTIVRSFKSAVTKRINELRRTPGAKLWQRGFYEHIIRNEPELNRIRQYIMDNTIKWSLDGNYPGDGSQQVHALTESYEEKPWANAVYHRSYEIREPVEVRITREEDLVVLSFPGPDHSVSMEDLRAGKAVSRRYRNRRIGEFLKELDLTEGRSTGITKILKAMAANGSPPPEFETDEGRSYFITRLPVHPKAGKAAPAGARSGGPVTGEVKAHDEAHEPAGEVAPEVAPEVRLLKAFSGEMTRQSLQTALGLKDDEHFRKTYLLPALQAGHIEMTIPDKPRSSKQRYRLTDKGRRWLKDKGGAH